MKHYWVAIKRTNIVILRNEYPITVKLVNSTSYELTLITDYFSKLENKMR